MNTQDALRIIQYAARLRSVEGAAAWIAYGGFTEAQCQLIGDLLAACPTVRLPAIKPQPKEVTTRCVGCGEMFTYVRVTKPQKWCTDACRSRNQRRWKREPIERAERERQLQIKRAARAAARRKREQIYHFLTYTRPATTHLDEHFPDDHGEVMDWDEIGEVRPKRVMPELFPPRRKPGPKPGPPPFRAEPFPADFFDEDDEPEEPEDLDEPDSLLGRAWRMLFP
jgi:hypothetical protein